jgi:hypothetical protein
VKKLKGQAKPKIFSILFILISLCIFLNGQIVCVLKGHTLCQAFVEDFKLLFHQKYPYPTWTHCMIHIQALAYTYFRPELVSFTDSDEHC